MDSTHISRNHFSHRMRGLHKIRFLLKPARLNQARLNHWAVVLNRDVFLDDKSTSNPMRETSHKFNFYPTSSTDFNSIYLDGNGAGRNSYLEEHMERNPQLKALLEGRTQHFKRFLGDAFKLPFEDLLPVVCGLANMKIKQASSPTGSVFDQGFIHQNVLREIAKRLFLTSLNNGTVFTDLSYLSMSQSELEHNLAYFRNHDRLIIEFMKRQLLYSCLIPYRGIQDYGKLLATEANLLRTEIKNETAVGSFHSLLGILVLRFGSTAVTTKFLYDKVLGGPNGIYSIATSTTTG